MLHRTKALVLELLAAICLVKGGHQIILGAFSNFKDVCAEDFRFQTLMKYFVQYDIFQIEFMVSGTSERRANGARRAYDVRQRPGGRAVVTPRCLVSVAKRHHTEMKG